MSSCRWTATKRDAMPAWKLPGAVASAPPGLSKSHRQPTRPTVRRSDSVPLHPWLFLRIAQIHLDAVRSPSGALRIQRNRYHRSTLDKPTANAEHPRRQTSSFIGEATKFRVNKPIIFSAENFVTGEAKPASLPDPARLAVRKLLLRTRRKLRFQSVLRDGPKERRNASAFRIAIAFDRERRRVLFGFSVRHRGHEKR
jgi:hypothetical protein